MAVKNGEAFLEEQLNSILPQLRTDDEIVISDDHSSDQSLNLVRKLGDQRIRVLVSGGSGMVANFENSLRQSRGDIIFLADQDDVWESTKIARMTRHLQLFDLVVCDCLLIDEQKARLGNESYFTLRNSGSGFVKNLIQNSYMGCCMGFHRRILTKALPFPPNIPMHDAWIGLVAELHFHTMFLNEPLVYHRRHSANASSTGHRSRQSYSYRFSHRYQLLKNLVKRKYDV